MENTNRKELVEKLAAQEEISKAKASRIIYGFLQGIKEQVVAGNRIVLSGFGSFYSKIHKSRKARNLTTNQEVIIPERLVPHWKAAKEVKQEVSSKKE